ncbi:MAG: SPOR domain-containing protein [Acidimicrobiia bacterium]|nr:SPOR domain-containing protein [Acidimicrobiia bacterium]
MTDREFREIQLSGKQLVFLFISAVVAAVVIFLLGVAVGRDIRSAADTQSASATGTETVVPIDPQAQPVQDLAYHDLLTGSGAPAPTPPPDTGPPPTPPAETTPPPAAQPEPAPTAVTGDWFLQVGAYGGRQAADGVVGNLKKLNVPAFVLAPGAGASDRLFRVRVGPYVTRAEADGVRARLAREGYTPRIQQR